MTEKEFFIQAITNEFIDIRRPGERTALYYLRKNRYLKPLKRWGKWVTKEAATRPFKLNKRIFTSGEVR